MISERAGEMIIQERAQRVRLIVAGMVPSELEALLEADPHARRSFEFLTLMQQRRYIEWIRSARLADIRLTRAALVLRAIGA